MCILKQIIIIIYEVCNKADVGQQLGWRQHVNWQPSLSTGATDDDSHDCLWDLQN